VNLGHNVEQWLCGIKHVSASAYTAINYQLAKATTCHIRRQLSIGSSLIYNRRAKTNARTRYCTVFSRSCVARCTL